MKDGKRVFRMRECFRNMKHICLNFLKNIQTIQVYRICPSDVVEKWRGIF